MKVLHLGSNCPFTLLTGKEYDVISIERGWYRLETEVLGDYLFPPEFFIITEP